MPCEKTNSPQAAIESGKAALARIPIGRLTLERLGTLLASSKVPYST